MKLTSDKLAEIGAVLVVSAAFLMIGAILTGCQTTEPKVIEKVVIIKPKVPKSLIDCDSDKPVYQHQTVTVKKSLAFTDQVMTWGERCSAKNRAIGKIVDVE